MTTPTPREAALKPCPFCGSERLHEECTGAAAISGQTYQTGWIECLDCNGVGPAVELTDETPAQNDYQLVRNAWNHRAALAQPVPDAVAWHIRIRGCDGSADWVELGATKPSDIPREADALPLVYAQTVADAVPPDWLLRSKVADLLHLLQFSAISTATGGDDVQAQKVMTDLRTMLAAAHPQQPAADHFPDAGNMVTHPQQPAHELAAALGWPGGIADPAAWPDLLREVARLRTAHGRPNVGIEPPRSGRLE